MNLCQQIGHHMQQLTRIEGELEDMRGQLAQGGQEQITVIQEKLNDKEQEAHTHQAEIETLQLNAPGIFESQMGIVGYFEDYHKRNNRHIEEFPEEGMAYKTDQEGYLVEVILDREAIPRLSGDLRRLRSLKHLTLKSVDVTDIPEELYTHPSLEKLTIKDTKGDLDVKRLRSMPQLKSLRLEGLTELGENFSDLWSLSFLTDLSLDLYEDKDISLQGIRNLSSLKSLEINSSGKIKDIAELWNLSEITKLHLSEVESGEDMSGLRSLSKLTDLSLEGPTAFSSHQAIWTLSSLQKLKIDHPGEETAISFNGIQHLSQLETLELRGVWEGGATERENIWEIPNLKELIMQEVVIDPSGMGQLIQLTHLTLKALECEENADKLLEEIAKLKALKRLEIEKIEEMGQCPETFGQFPELETLSLNELGEMDHIPSIHCPKLRLLLLSKVPLRDLPEGLERSPNLIDIYCEDVALETCPESLAHNAALWRLHLENTKIETIPTGIFPNLTALEECSLKGSPVRDLPEDLDQASALKKLDISGTSIPAPRKFKITLAHPTINLID